MYQNRNNLTSQILKPFINFVHVNVQNFCSFLHFIFPSFEVSDRLKSIANGQQKNEKKS